jgi:hypothetical protein
MPMPSTKERRQEISDQTTMVKEEIKVMWTMVTVPMVPEVQADLVQGAQVVQDQADLVVLEAGPDQAQVDLADLVVQEAGPDQAQVDLAGQVVQVVRAVQEAPEDNSPIGLSNRFTFRKIPLLIKYTVLS